MRVRAPFGRARAVKDCMKIVHVIPALTKGGAERVVIDLANEAVERGHQVTILCAVPAPAEQLPRPLRPEVAQRYISPSGRSRRAAYAAMLPWLLRNRRWLRDQDVIHCHLTAASVFGTLVQWLRRGRSPVVVETYHAVGMAIPDRQRAFHAALLGRRDAVAFMADDPFWARFREARPASLFRTIPNGIVPLPPIITDASETYRRTKTRIPEGALVVGSIGRLVPARRPDLLMEAFAHLAKTTSADVHLLLGGEGPERDRLLAQASAHGIAGRVHLPGLVLDPREPLGLIDLYWTINIGPITGIAALEAAFAGVPMIALQLQKSYREGVNDWIPSSAKPADVASRAEDLLEDDKRAELAKRQGAHVAAHFGVEAMALAYLEFYKSACERALQT